MNTATYTMPNGTTFTITPAVRALAADVCRADDDYEALRTQTWRGARSIAATKRHAAVVAFTRNLGRLSSTTPDYSVWIPVCRAIASVTR